MVRGKSRHVLSPSEVQTLKRERQDTSTMLAEVDRESWGDKGRLDRDALNRQIKRLDKAIEDGTPRQLRGANKDKMAKRAKELEAKFKEGMPTRNEMWNLRDNPGAPVKNLNWQKRNSKGIQEYKQIMRSLEPGDPTASNVERLRRK